MVTTAIDSAGLTRELVSAHSAGVKLLSFEIHNKLRNFWTELPIPDIMKSHRSDVAEIVSDRLRILLLQSYPPCQGEFNRD